MDDETNFPLILNKKLPVLQEPRIFLLLEGAFSKMKPTLSRYDICRIGLPKAWRADSMFGLVIESDVDHLAELSSSFTSNNLFLDDGLEVVKIESNIFLDIQFNFL